MNRIVRAFEARIDTDRADRTITATINTDAVDRYRTVILPEGGQLDAYRKNPVVLYNHDLDQVIGRNLWVKTQKRKMLAKTQFIPEGRDELADKVFMLYDLGYLNAWSISFDPVEASSPTPEEIRKRPDLATCNRIYRKWDLLEYSCVTVPGNPEAVREAFRRGLALPGWTAPDEDDAEPTPAPEQTPELPALVGRSFEAVHASLVRQIRGLGSDGAAEARAMLDLQLHGRV